MAEYYIDFTNGSDAKDGTSDPTDIAAPHSAEASTDATHVYVTDGVLTDGDADDFFNGDYIFNVTRDAGAIISDYDDDDGGGNSVITHGNITNQVSTDTFYILKSWKTLSKPATTCAAGDTARVRGGMTETLVADVNFTNDGTINSYITITGIYTAAGSDDWGDGDTTRPVIDADNNIYHLILNSDNYWHVEGLKVTKSTYTAGGIYCYLSYGIKIVDCELTGNTSVGIRIADCSGGVMTDCIIHDNGISNVQAYGGGLRIDGCFIYGGTGGTTYGINFSSGATILHISNTMVGNSGGGVSEHSGGDLRGYYNSIIFCRNVKLDSTTQVAFPAFNGTGYVRSEDDGQIFGAFTQWSTFCTIIKDTGETPPGGSGWAFKATPLADVGASWLLYMVGDEFEGFPVYLDGTEQTITVKMKCLDADWSLGGGAGGRPDNTELYIDVEYHNAATTLTTAVSTAACTDDTYTSFTVTITPSAEGKATVRPKLEIYEASAPVYIDPVVLVT